MAAHRITSTIEARTTTRNPTVQEAIGFLNTSPDREESRLSYDVRSLYSLVRGCYQRLSAKVVFTEEEEVKLKVGDTLITKEKARSASALLRDQRLAYHLESLTKFPDQGKSFHSVARHTSSNSWIPDGKYISFAEYRFASKARLNVLPTRTVLKWSKQLRGTINCRRCGSHPETLAHALNHCHHSMGLIRTRQGEILKRLRHAIPRDMGEVFLEQQIPGDPERNCPDLVIINREKNKIIVVDVTMPFEGEPRSLAEARETKLQKYSNLKTWLQGKYSEVELEAFIVGALGSWDLDNKPVLHMLHIGRNYSKLFRRLCCISAIAGSNNIWKAFCRSGS